MRRELSGRQARREKRNENRDRASVDSRSCFSFSSGAFNLAYQTHLPRRSESFRGTFFR